MRIYGFKLCARAFMNSYFCCVGGVSVASLLKYMDGWGRRECGL